MMNTVKTINITVKAVAKNATQHGRVLIGGGSSN